MSTPSSAQSNPLVPPGFGGVPLPAAIPQSVQRAFFLWVGIIALNILGTIVQSLGDLGSAVGVVGALIGGAVGVFFALHFRGGRNWARIVLAVLTSIALLFTVIGLLGILLLFAFAPFSALIALIVCAGVIVGGALALINAFSGEANAYFAANSN